MNERYKEIIEKVYAERIRQGTEKGIEGLVKRASEANDYTMAALLLSVENYIRDCEGGNMLARYEGTKRGLPIEPMNVEVRKDYKTLGEALADFREQLKLTRERFAAIFGISRRTLYRMETEEVKWVGESTKRAIYEKLNINPQEKKDKIFALPVKRQESL